MYTQVADLKKMLNKLRFEISFFLIKKKRLGFTPSVPNLRLSRKFYFRYEADRKASTIQQLMVDYEKVINFTSLIRRHSPLTGHN